MISHGLLSLSSPPSSSMADAAAHCSSNYSWGWMPSRGTQRRRPEAVGWKLHHRSPSSRIIASQDKMDGTHQASSIPMTKSDVGLAGYEFRERGRGEREREKEEKERERRRKEEVNKKIASKKAISVILRREATKEVIEKKRGTNAKKLLPRTVLEALHERIKALRWESALKVFELLREQMWYRPNVGIYIKLIVMLGKCKQPERAQILFQSMVDEGCPMNHEAYTALLSAYSRSGLLDEAFSLLETMKSFDGCHPDVHTYSILIKSCLQISQFEKVQSLLLDMKNYGVQPNTITYNTLIDAYGKSGRFAEMELTLSEMLRQRDCKPDVWTMNATLRAFGGSQQIETMEKCYDKFRSSGISPNIKTFNILLDAYGKSNMYDKMSAVMEFMQKYYFSWTAVTYNVVIDAFGRAGDLKQMEYVFRLMKSEGIKPNCVTLCSIVRAYGRVNAVDKIKGVLRLIENSDILLDTIFFNCLMDAYGRAGSLAEMKEVLEMMEKRGCKPDKITYSTMIKAYSSKGVANRLKDICGLSSEDIFQSRKKSTFDLDMSDHY